MNDVLNERKNRRFELDKMQSGMAKFDRNKKQDTDDRFWRPSVDKQGIGSALIRLLPPVEGEDSPIVRYWDHAFKGPGGWYIEKSLKSLDMPDPVWEMNGKLYESGKSGQAVYYGDPKEKRPGTRARLHYVVNVYVINDPAQPDNNGKNFLFQFGPEIYDKIKEAMHPPFQGIAPINPFHPWEGSNLHLMMKNAKGDKTGVYRTYASSVFESPGPLFDNDGAIEAVLNNVYPLQPFVDPKSYKSYDELAKRLDRVMKGNKKPVEENDLEASKVSHSPRNRISEDDEKPWDDESPEPTSEADSYFEKLANR